MFEAEWLGGAGSPEAGAVSVVTCGERPGAGVLDRPHGSEVRPRPRVRLHGGRAGGKSGNTGRNQLEPAADGTDATESFEPPGTLLTRRSWMVAGSAAAAPT